MNKKLQASSFIEIAEENGLIPIFPKGITSGQDGRGPYKLANAAAVIEASMREHVDLVIDRDHQIDLAPPGTPIKAAGWMKELVEKDGAIWARVEWTPSAAQELKDKEYRYISPTFMHDKKTGTVTRILRATLTNSPNFDMKAVASKISKTETEEPEEENETMNKTLLAIAAMLGLAAPDTEEAVLAKVKEVNEKLATASQDLKVSKTQITAIAKAVGLEESATGEEIATAAATRKAGETDPSKFVPIAQFDELKTELASMKKDSQDKNAEEAVTAAMKAGKVAPAQKDWAMDYAKQNLTGFQKYVENSPVIVTAGETQTSKKVDADKLTLDDEDKAICSMLNLSEDSYKKELAA